MSRAKKSALTRRTLLGGGAVAGAGAFLAASVSSAYAGGGGPIDQRSIDAGAARLDRDLITLRRDLHRHPETAGEERRTAAVVAARLRSAGLSVTTGVGGHGVVGVLQGARPGRTVAYRADIDAVPPADQIGGGSTGAHLCGHDLHTAIGVGIAEVLARLRHRLSGRVVFFFQPAEETLAGARAMVADGALERTRPEEIHALHCGPLPVGQLAITPGTGLPGQDRAFITLPPGPEADAQAQELAAALAGLGTVGFPEGPADLEQLVRDIQTPDGPLARFVFMRANASEGVVQLSYRCWPEERSTEIRNEIRRLAGAYTGSQVSFPAEPFPAMLCPEKEGWALGRHLRHVLGRDAVTVVHAPVPFSGEDYPYFLDQIPGTYSYLGVRRPGADITACYPHMGTFDPDEQAIGTGVRAMAGWLATRSRRGH